MNEWLCEIWVTLVLIENLCSENVNLSTYIGTYDILPINYILDRSFLPINCIINRRIVGFHKLPGVCVCIICSVQLIYRSVYHHVLTIVRGWIAFRPHERINSKPMTNRYDSTMRICRYTWRIFLRIISARALCGKIRHGLHINNIIYT